MASTNYKSLFQKSYELYIKSKSKEDKRNYELAKRNYESFLEVNRILQTKNDFYKVMNVLKTASEEEIKNAYKTIARQIHPNACKIENCEEAFKIVNEAKETLLDKNKRAIYDQRDNPFNTVIFNAGQSHSPYNNNFNEFFYRCNFEDNDTFFTPEEIFRMAISQMRRPRRRPRYREQEDYTVGNFLRILIIFLICIKLISFFI